MDILRKLPHRSYNILLFPFSFLLPLLVIVLCNHVDSSTNNTNDKFPPLQFLHANILNFPNFPHSIIETLTHGCAHNEMKYSVIFTPSTKYYYTNATSASSSSIDEQINEVIAEYSTTLAATSVITMSRNTSIDLLSIVFCCKDETQKSGDVSYLLLSSGYESFTTNKEVPVFYTYFPNSFIRVSNLLPRNETGPCIVMQLKQPFENMRIYLPHPPRDSHPHSHSHSETDSHPHLHTHTHTHNKDNRIEEWMIHIFQHEYFPEHNSVIVSSYQSFHLHDIFMKHRNQQIELASNSFLFNYPLIIHVLCDLHGEQATQLCHVKTDGYPRFSHNGQEEEVIAHLQGKRHGVYIDIGANDGITHSNTYVLEKYFGWSGVLVEPLKRLVPSLLANRSMEWNSVVNACVYDRAFLAEFLDVEGSGEFSGVADTWPWFDSHAMGSNYTTVKVPCYHIQEVIDAHGLTHVDYLSVDAEGADMVILEAIDWSRFSASIVSVECHGHEKEAEALLKSLFLEQLNYKTMKRKGWDLMFFKD